MLQVAINRRYAHTIGSCLLSERSQANRRARSYAQAGRDIWPLRALVARASTLPKSPQNPLKSPRKAAISGSKDP
ncbi:hypothetical protein JQ604_40215 [Bradyrhizobium jicamae]|uniref:hypothetical protein n=1 Tax=Bradyrhizobium jicamae TaxID=280332 RepID=UPI001BAC42C7|nr:hypothetical protein [Bradyrhizobium jicamae]MBR0758442.1 hypothetical protein [Bradyrhizobium jicamae]